MAIGEDKHDIFRRDLDEAAAGIDQLKREYDMFFAGVLKHQPFELRGRVEAIMRRLRATTIAKLELTFRLSTLQARWAKQVELWDKIFKRREFDPHAVSPYGPSREQLAKEMGAALRARDVERETRHGEAARPDGADSIRSLYNQYVDAKKELGETVDSLKYAVFQRQLEKQKEAIKERTGASDVAFTVTRKDGKVSLKAKPVRDTK